MRELRELLALAEALGSTLPRLVPGRPDAVPDQCRREMLLSVRRAVDLTRGYLACLGDSLDHRSGHGSLALRHAWSTVGVDLLRYDPELARLCVLRSFYWSSPETWSEEEAERASLAFRELGATLKELMDGHTGADGQ